jgi:hypothetical protein
MVLFSGLKVTRNLENEMKHLSLVEKNHKKNEMSLV